MDPLAFTDAGVPVEAGILAGQVISQELTFDYTNSLVADLRSLGYVSGINLFMFGYDWRQDLTQNADINLKNFVTHVIAQTNAERVNIIAHSQGGLVAKKMLYDLPDIRSKISKLVFVGTPQ